MKAMKLSSMCFSVVVGMLIGLATVWATPTEAVKEKGLIDEPRIAFKNFMPNSNMTWFRDTVKYAKGMVIVPGLYKAGFIVGRSRGNGVFS